MRDKVGIVAFSFALRDEGEEPNPCNVRLAEAVERIAALEQSPVIVAQWEVARKLTADGIRVIKAVESQEGVYLDSEGVWTEARRVFRDAGVTSVIPVAQPFLQLQMVTRMIKRSGFKVTRRKIGWIGFDRKSTQPWTRGPIRTLLYAVRRGLFGSQGLHR